MLCLPSTRRPMPPPVVYRCIHVVFLQEGPHAAPTHHQLDHAAPTHLPIEATFSASPGGNHGTHSSTRPPTPHSAVYLPANPFGKPPVGPMTLPTTRPPVRQQPSTYRRNPLVHLQKGPMQCVHSTTQPTALPPIDLSWQSLVHLQKRAIPRFRPTRPTTPR